MRGTAAQVRLEENEVLLDAREHLWEEPFVLVRTLSYATVAGQPMLPLVLGHYTSLPLPGTRSYAAFIIREPCVLLMFWGSVYRINPWN